MANEPKKEDFKPYAVTMRNVRTGYCWIWYSPDVIDAAHAMRLGELNCMGAKAISAEGIW
jgi:hypothetical protein